MFSCLVVKGFYPPPILSLSGTTTKKILFFMCLYPKENCMKKQKGPKSKGLIPTFALDPFATENYSKKTGSPSNKSRHCAYIIYSVKTWFKKKDMLCLVDF